MKTSIKVIISLVLCIVFCIPAYAIFPVQTSDTQAELCNDNLSSCFDLPELTFTLHGETAYSDGEAEAEYFYESLDDVIAAVRAELVSRNNTFVVGYKTSTKLTQEKYDAISEELFYHTGNPKEGDYLWFTFGGYSGGAKGYRDGDYYYYTLSFDAKYYTTAEQEAELDIAIKNIRSHILQQCDNDYEIVQAIYDVICNNVKYDHTNLEDKSYVLKYTAYAALINKTAVCQGYANLFYRLALECGVDARTVSGMSDDVAHAWNIVKLDGYYYNVDSTWDSTLRQANRKYEYFLKCDSTFINHTPNEKYLTEDFTTEYPKYKNDYNKNAPAHNHEPYDVWHVGRYAAAGVDGEKFRICATCNETVDVTPIPYVFASTLYTGYTEKSWSAEGINFVSSNGLMGSVGNGEFNQTGTMTRSMFVTVLWRLAGSPLPECTAAFTDLDPKQKWYHNAVAWAAENGIVNGTSQYTFSPNGEVTREQIATLLFRYTAVYLGEDLSDETNSDISSFPDVGSVSKYALSAMAWAYGRGLIKGQSGSDGISVLAPKNNASREEVAVVIARFCTSK